MDQKVEIKIGKYFEMNEPKNVTYQKLWGSVK